MNNPGIRIQCNHVWQHGPKKGQQCGRTIIISNITDPKTATCHDHGNVRKTLSSVGGSVTQAYLNKENTVYGNPDIETVAKLINLQKVGEKANDVYGTNYKVDDVRVCLYNTGQAHDSSRPGYIYNASEYIAHIRPEYGVIMFNRGDEAITFPIEDFLKTYEDEGEPDERYPQEDYGQDDDKDDCSDELPFIVAGTGSRSLKTADPAFKALVVAWTRARLLRLKEKYGDRLVIMSGMAEGWDELLAVLAKELGIRLWAYVPNKGYGRYYWSAAHSLTGKNRIPQFDSLLEYAEKVEYTMEDRLGISGLYAPNPDKPGKTEHANFARNRAMVEDADAFLVWDPSSSGTAHAFGLIKKSGKPFEICNTKVS